MSLVDLQNAIAALICDKKSLAAYAGERARWLAEHPLRARDRRLLDDLDVDSIRAFHEIHARDRAYFLEAILPLTTSRLGEAWPDAYFERRPYGADDLRREAEAFVHDLASLTEDPATQELGRFELRAFVLLEEPPFEPAPGPGVSDPSSACLAPGLAVLSATTPIPRLVEDPRATITPTLGAVLLRRDEDGVTPAWIEGPSATLLVAVSRRDLAALSALVGTPEGQDAYREALAQGVFV